MEPINSPNSPTRPRIRVVVVDDHRVVAEGLVALLTAEDDLAVVGTATSVAEALALVDQTRPDVVLLDYRLPDGDGISATLEIRRRAPETKVVMVSAVGHGELLARAIDAGCAGFLAKERSGDELLAAVRAAQRGDAFLPAALLADLIGRPRPGGAGSRLTARELEVLSLLAAGLSTAAVTERLGRSEHTVRNHVRNILGKLGAHSKLEAVAIAAREGLISLESRAEA